MQVTTASLSKACGVAVKVLAAKPIKPVLACFRMRSSHDKLTIEATDLELSVRLATTLDAGTLVSDFLIDGELLTSIVKTARGETITLSPNGTKCGVDVGGTKFDLTLSDADDFPSLTEPSKAPSLSINAKTLKKMLATTKFSVADSSKQYALHGIGITAEDGTLHCIASDSTGLAWAKAECDKTAKVSLCSVPVAAMEAICSLADDDAEIELWFTAVEIQARCGGSIVSGRLYEGKFPGLAMIKSAGMDSTPQASIQVKAGELLAALKQVSLVVDLESNSIEARILADRLELKTASSTGNSQASVALAGDVVASATFLFDAPRVVAAVNVLESDSIVTVGWNGDKPLSLRCGEWSFWIPRMERK